MLGGSDDALILHTKYNFCNLKVYYYDSVEGHVLQRCILLFYLSLIWYMVGNLGSQYLLHFFLVSLTSWRVLLSHVSYFILVSQWH